MSKDHLSAKERETRKVTIILHGALTVILNSLEEKDYPKTFVTMNSNNLANIIFDENKFMEQFKLMYQDEERKLTIFDKALCLAMAIGKNKVINTVEADSKTPKRMIDLNEKLITETVLLYVGHSSYHVKRTDMSGDFSFKGFDDGHKTDFKYMKSLLTEEFKKVNFDYNKCMALLQEIYLRGICYLEGLPTGQIYDLKKKTTIKEKYSSPITQVEEKNTYSTYKKNFRSLK